MWLVVVFVFVMRFAQYSMYLSIHNGIALYPVYLSMRERCGEECYKLQ
jgi:hypothetical protein